MAKAREPEHTATEWVLRRLPPQQDITRMFYFYDGELPVVDGYIRVPRGNNTWAQRLLMLGYAWVGKMPEDFSDVR